MFQGKTVPNTGSRTLVKPLVASSHIV